MDSLGRTLKQRRLMRELTLEGLSQTLGVSPSHIGRVERGDRFPSARVLRKLADPLGFNEVELLKLAGFMSRDETDDRLERFKQEVKWQLMTLIERVDKLV